MGEFLVYTDKKGNPEHVLEIHSDFVDLNTENDIVQLAMLWEENGYDIGDQQDLIESVFGEGCAHFRDLRQADSDQRYATGTSKQGENGTGRVYISELSAKEESGARGEVTKKKYTDLSRAEAVQQAARAAGYDTDAIAKENTGKEADNIRLKKVRAFTVDVYDKNQLRKLTPVQSVSNYGRR